MSKRIEKDAHITGMLMLGAIMGGQSMDEVVDELGKSAQSNTIARKDFARKRSGHDLIWQTLGFIFHEEGDHPDSHLQPTTLPEGWKVESTNHYMHNKVVDCKGRQRAHFMYKSDFWDRSASAYLHVRFTITQEYGETHNEKQIVVIDNSLSYDDPNQIIAKSDWIVTPYKENGQRDYEKEDQLLEAARKNFRDTWFADNAPLLNEENLEQAKAQAIAMIKKAQPEAKSEDIDQIRDRDLLALLYWD